LLTDARNPNVPNVATDAPRLQDYTTLAFPAESVYYSIIRGGYTPE